MLVTSGAVPGRPMCDGVRELTFVRRLLDESTMMNSGFRRGRDLQDGGWENNNDGNRMIRESPIGPSLRNSILQFGLLTSLFHHSTERKTKVN